MSLVILPALSVSEFYNGSFLVVASSDRTLDLQSLVSTMMQWVHHFTRRQDLGVGTTDVGASPSR